MTDAQHRSLPAPLPDFLPELLDEHLVDVVTISRRLEDLSDDHLETVIQITDRALLVNRLARIERGKRHEDRRGVNLTPGIRSLSQPEMNARSEERKVAEWNPPVEVVAETGWKKLVSRAREELREPYTPEEQAEQDRLGAIRRDRERLESIISCWSSLKHLNGHTYEQEIIAGMVEPDRIALEKIRREIGHCLDRL